MSGLQDVTNQAVQRPRRIVSGDEEDAFMDWINRAQLSRDDERWIVALLKSKYREGRREGLAEARSAAADAQHRFDQLRAEAEASDRRIRDLQETVDLLAEDARYWHELWLAKEEQNEVLRGERDDLAAQLHEKNASIQALEQQLRDRTDDLREEAEARDALQRETDRLDDEARYWFEELLSKEDQSEALRRERDDLEAQLVENNAATQALEEQLRDRTDDLSQETEAREALEHEVHAGRGEIGEQDARIEALREQITQLKACVYAERFRSIPIPAADTEYPQDPDTVIAQVTKSGIIALFRKYMIGKRRSHEEADGFAGRNVAEFLDLLAVEEGPHAEAIALLSPVENGVFRERDVREQKRQRIE